MKTFLIAFFLSYSAHAAKIVLLTDQPGAAAANKLRDLFAITPPFSRMPELEIRVEERAKIECEKVTGLDTTTKEGVSEREIPSCIAEAKAEAEKKANLATSLATDKEKSAVTKEQKRLVSCADKSHLNAIQAELNADYMIYVRNDPIDGGGGGDGVTIVNTPSSDSLTTIGLHEFMHAIGFADQYPYQSVCNADRFCNPTREELKEKIGRNGYGPFPRVAANLVSLPDEAPYASDAQARNRHGSQIPWFSKIKASTPIVTGNQLGTPKKNVIGLFPARTCENTTEKMKLWRAGEETNIMLYAFTNYIPKVHWEVIAQALSVKISSTPNPKEELFIYRTDPETKLRKRFPFIPIDYDAPVSEPVKPAAGIK